MQRFLVSMLGMSLCLGSVSRARTAEPKEQQANAVAEIEKLGGSARAFGSTPGWPSYSI
jgi:hypothetical protein